MQMTACLFRNRMEREVTARDRTSISPPRYHAGHYSQSPSRFHDHELSFQRQERHAGPRTRATFSAKRSQSPVENGPGVNVTEKSWSRRYYLFFYILGCSSWHSRGNLHLCSSRVLDVAQHTVIAFLRGLWSLKWKFWVWQMTGCCIHSVAMERVQGKKLPVFLFCSPHGHACLFWQNGC